MKRTSCYYNLLKKIIIALGLFLIMDTYILGIANVNGDSMHPTLNTSDKVVFLKLPYFRRNIKRGDIIIFAPPEKLGRKDEFFVKRVVAVEKDMYIIQNGVLGINDIEVFEDYICPEDYIDKNYCYIEGTVPKDKFFVLGDNRNNSNDSRRFCCIGNGLVKGRAVLRIWPLNKMTTFSNPYN